ACRADRHRQLEQEAGLRFEEGGRIGFQPQPRVGRRRAERQARPRYHPWRGVKPDSDIPRGAADSGLHLTDPKDSGISLEEPLVLGGGSNKELLELGEADVISVEENADMEGATQLKPDEDFLLTPVQETAADESDSGSQVIALDAD